MKYTITGRKFADEPSYYDWDNERKYPNFEIVDKIEIEREAKNSDEAYLWMLANIPNYAIGCSIIREDKNEFLLLPVKDYYAILPELPDCKQETLVKHEIDCVLERMHRANK